MKGIHRIINHNWNIQDISVLEKYALKCDSEYSLIYLDHDVYRSLVAKGILVIPPKRYHDILTWYYSLEEIQESEYCLLENNRYYCGYPQPDDYERIVYDQAIWCDKCGMVRSQINDFRVKKVSKHLMWGFFAWNFEALFVDRAIYDELFKPHGIECRPLRYVSGNLRDDFVQLVIPAIEEDMDKSYFDKGYESVCPKCGRTKYWRDYKKPFFPLHDNPLPHIYMSKEYFGEGLVADRHIFISTELALELVRRKALKLEHLTPCHKNIEEFLKTVDY